ncbi:hypothetical protein GDO81_021896 [Engystomops pustulosus]|uniref:Uncharacterized protein n=1 Tax=Engystomops pustulosus TaxID=76066 RepID=A0AAV6ZY65_ENGPU|nr:hypothetical protein GDO81_021896 [Engystomops pustulosus]
MKLFISDFFSHYKERPSCLFHHYNFFKDGAATSVICGQNISPPIYNTNLALPRCKNF